MSCWIDVQNLKIHERSNGWWNGATQLIRWELPVQHHQSTSIEREREWVSIREVCNLLVGGGEEHWRRRAFVDVMLDWRTSTWDSRETQSMMEWCHSVDCCRATCSISSINKHREREWESEYSWGMWSACWWWWRALEKKSICGCHVGLTYKISRFTRDPIDDGMVPLSWLYERSLFNIINQQASREREREYSRGM